MRAHTHTCNSASPDLTLGAPAAQDGSRDAGSVSGCLREGALQVDIVSRLVPQGVIPCRPGPHRQGATCLDQPVEVILLALAPGAHVKLKVAAPAEAL